MAWDEDFSDLVTDFFDMSALANFRFFLVIDGARIAGQKAPPTYEELVFTNYTPVPRAPKNIYALLPADKRERDHCLVWFPPGEGVERLQTTKTVDGKNAGRILDVDRSKWYVVSKEFDYLRQGRLNGVVGELVDGLPPSDLPAPPP